MLMHSLISLLCLLREASKQLTHPLLFPPNKQATAHCLPVPDATQSMIKKSALPTSLPRSRTSASAVVVVGCGGTAAAAGEPRHRCLEVNWTDFEGRRREEESKE